MRTYRHVDMQEGRREKGNELSLCLSDLFSVRYMLHSWGFASECGEILYCVYQHLISKESSLKVGRRSLPSFARGRARLPKLASIHGSKQILEVAVVCHTCIDVTSALPSQAAEERRTINAIQDEQEKKRENTMHVKNRFQFSSLTNNSFHTRCLSHHIVNTALYENNRTNKLLVLQWLKSSDYFLQN